MYRPVRLALVMLMASSTVAISAQAQLAGSTVASTAKNGFSGGTGICKEGSASRTVMNGGELVSTDWTGGCIGFFSVDFSNTGFVLTVREGGNYSFSNLNMLFTGGPTITGASFLGYTGNFFTPPNNDPANDYGFNDSNFPPIVTFTGSSIDVLWNTNDDTFPSGQFRFNDASIGTGTASFSYTTMSSVVPEPTSIALFAAGLVGVALSRRRRTIA